MSVQHCSDITLLPQGGFSCAMIGPMSESEPLPKNPVRVNKMPLYLRLYQDQTLIDVARMVGYAGLSLPAARERLRELNAIHNKDKLVAAVEELTEISAETVQLKADVRRLCFQLLGFPPEQKDTPIANSLGSPQHNEAADAPKPKEKKPAQPSQKKRSKRASAEPQADASSTDDTKERTAQTTPLMEQYRAAKAAHPDMVLLFRIGEFYEVLDADADVVHRILGLTLTTRDRITKMCGFPHHQLEAYLHELLKEGLRVAVCDQIDTTTKSVRREITRVVPEVMQDETDAEVTSVGGVKTKILVKLRKIKKNAPGNAEGKPVRQPRHFVMQKFEEYMTAEGLAFVPVADVKKTTPAVAPHVAGLDYVVLMGEEKLLVTVRPNLTKKNAAAAKEVQKLFGNGYQAIRIWPIESEDGWVWDRHPIIA